MTVAEFRNKHNLTLLDLKWLYRTLGLTLPIVLFSGMVFLISGNIKSDKERYNQIISLPASEQLLLFQSCAKNYSLNCQNALYDYQKQH